MTRRKWEWHDVDEADVLRLQQEAEARRVEADRLERQRTGYQLLSDPLGASVPCVQCGCMVFAGYRDKHRETCVWEADL